VRLALLGGEPAFPRPLAVGVPILEADTRERYHRLMAGAFDRNWLTNDGPLVRQLEEELARLHAVRHCALLCNATMAQVLLLRALDLHGEVVLPSFTFAATAHACAWQGLTPVFCDISPDSLMAGPAEVERAITRETRAVIGVHLFGNVCDTAGLAETCARRELTLFFDAAHAFGCTLGDTPIGGSGRAEILSFHATKAFSTFEGGAVLTNDSDLDARIRALRNFGFRGYDDVAFVGLNGKLSESGAALGLASLPAVEGRRKRCQAIYEAYRDGLADIPGVRVLPVGQQGRSNYHYVPVLIEVAAFGLSRDLLYRLLWAENVLARRYFYPGLHRMEAYARGAPGVSLPATESVAERILCLPSGFTEPVPTVEKIVGLFREARARVAELHRLEPARP
jgi:dTDP-4-amino-4,6-dideoxygalactose transaminase